MAQDLSPALQDLASAIRARDVRPKVVLCGFDLWIDALSSPHAKAVEFTPGGKYATGDEPPDTLKVPVMSLGNGIVISFDPTLAADKFILKP